MIKIIKIFFATALILAGAYLSSYFTKAGIAGWYAVAQKPAIVPPDGVFPIVWGILYALMILAMIVVFVDSDDKPQGALWKELIIQIVFQIFWCFVFFEQQQLGAGLIVITLMGLSALKMLNVFWHTNKISGFLLIPYGVWVWFAFVLNAAFLL